MSIHQKLLVRLGAILLIFAVSGVINWDDSSRQAAFAAVDANMKHEPIVEELIRILEVKPEWTLQFAKDWGSFLDTTESAKELETFYTDPIYHIDDYVKAPSGWLTFNQFFARHVKPGKRPIDGLCDDSVIVSPADSVFQGQWKIDEDSEITVKGLKWSVHKLLDGSPFKIDLREEYICTCFLMSMIIIDIMFLWEE